MADWKESLCRLTYGIAVNNPDQFVVTVNELVLASLELTVRQSFQADHIELLMKLAVDKIQAILGSSEVSRDVASFIIPVLKLLRNVCAQVEANQSIVSEENFLFHIVKLIGRLSNGADHEETNSSYALVLLKVSIQLLGNCSVNNMATKEMVWKLCHTDNCLFRVLLLNNTDPDILRYVCMVIYTCIKDHPDRTTELTTCNINGGSPSTKPISLFGILLSLSIAAVDCDWITLTSEEVLKIQSLEVLFEDLPSNARVGLLQRVFDFDKEIRSEYVDFVVTSFGKSVSDFVQECSNIVSLDESCLGKELEHLVRITAAVLDVLCQCSSHLKYLQVLQSQTILTKSAIDLLTCLSKYDGSSSLSGNISKLSQPAADDHSPPLLLHGMKRDLVQLIGNLCHRSAINQDYMSDHIPLILNQCGIDHSNPYITQWSIWAIRNICEGHSRNQEVVRHLERRGLGNMEELERNFGCEVEIDRENGRLKMKKKK